LYSDFQDFLFSTIGIQSIWTSPQWPG